MKKENLQKVVDFFVMYKDKNYFCYSIENSIDKLIVEINKVSCDTHINTKLDEIESI